MPRSATRTRIENSDLSAALEVSREAASGSNTTRLPLAITRSGRTKSVINSRGMSEYSSRRMASQPPLTPITEATSVSAARSHSSKRR